MIPHSVNHALLILLIVYCYLLTKYGNFTFHCDGTKKRRKTSEIEHMFSLKNTFDTNIELTVFGQSNKTAWVLTNVCLHHISETKNDYLFPLRSFNFNGSIVTFLPSDHSGKDALRYNNAYWIDTYDYSLTNLHHFFKDFIIDLFSVMRKLGVPLTFTKRKVILFCHSHLSCLFLVILLYH